MLQVFAPGLGPWIRELVIPHLGPFIAAALKAGLVLAGIDLTVTSSEIAVIVEDSGVGKTTLLKLAASLLKPTAGKVSCPASIGFVFQDDRLLPLRSVAENTALPLRCQRYPRKSALCFAQYLLAEAGLAGEEWRKPDELSGGMKKRAALARCRVYALHGKPTTLVEKRQ
jgi:NitT/TauT family transport system ATP-binding protein